MKPAGRAHWAARKKKRPKKGGGLGLKGGRGSGGNVLGLGVPFGTSR